MVSILVRRFEPSEQGITKNENFQILWLSVQSYKPMKKPIDQQNTSSVQRSLLGSVFKEKALLNALSLIIC